MLWNVEWNYWKNFSFYRVMFSNKTNNRYENVRLFDKTASPLYTLEYQFSEL